MTTTEAILERATRRLRELRESLGLQQNQFAAMFGVNSSSYSRYERGHIENMPRALIARISEKYDLNPAWLCGFAGVDKHPAPNAGKRRVPVFASIAAGAPILAQEDIMGYEYVDRDSCIDFCLHVKGNSMVGARIHDGDIVCMRQQEHVENGEIAAVMVGDNEATLKRFYRMDGAVLLKAENPDIPDQMYGKDDGVTIRILGKAVALLAEVR